MYSATLFANKGIYLTRDTLKQVIYTGKQLYLGSWRPSVCAPSKTQDYGEPRVYNNNNKFYLTVGWYYSEVTLG
jgi:hypothetical protein